MRSLARWGTLPLLFAPLGTWALGLGDIEMQSALNEPFRAEIEIASATPAELESLRIGLAPASTFERFGIARPSYLSTFQFDVGISAAGRNVVIVTSPTSITDPFVELLVEATSQTGRLLRQYTVFVDPPTFLPENRVAAVAPAQTRAPANAGDGGAIRRTPAPAPQQPAATRAPAPQPAPAPRAGGDGGTYGPVARSETLWGIASQLRPDGTSMNQMMVAVYQANPQAFDGNMNILHRGAILRIPTGAEIRSISASSATAEVARQTDAWRGGSAEAERRLVLVPPSEAPAATAGAGGGAGASAAANAEVEDLRGQVASLETELEESRRLLELRSEELRALQQQLGESGEEPAVAAAGGQTPAAGSAVDPGVELETEAPLESEQLFVDESEAEAETERPAEAATETPAPAPGSGQPGPAATTGVTTQPAPSLVDRIVGFAASPIVWIAAGGAVVVLGLLLFLRRRREEVDDVTGQWEALEAEVDDEALHSTARLSRKAALEEDESFVVQEQRAPTAPLESDLDFDAAETAAPPIGDRAKPSAAAEPVAPAAEPEPADPTLSSQTVINLDQADPIAEADFHMAYGLYDQAAELVSKALEAKPDSRELKLKLLEVFFVWGNKDAFLEAAQSLREEMGAQPDGDWDKVIIMGKQICPDEALFADATAAAGEVDVDLEAGDAPALDLAFDEGGSAGVDLDFGGASGELELEATAERSAAFETGSEDDTLETSQTAETAGNAQAVPESAAGDDGLDIGERTQAGLEAALLELDEQAAATTPGSDVDLDLDSLAETQESPTVETPRSDLEDSDGTDWAAETMESPTVEQVGPGATRAFDEDEDEDETAYAAMDSPTVESSGFQPTVEQRGPTQGQELTAELNLDDLGLDVTDVEGLPHDLGEPPGADDGESDTREQPAVGVESDLLSATGVTQVLRDDETDLDPLNTAVLGDEDATMMAPGYDTGRLSNTEVLEQIPDSAEYDLSGEEESDLDLNLDDFSAALEGSETVEQPRSSFGGDVFEGGADTPIDLDVGIDVPGDDDPTGTEGVSPLDPQTMTEVGTKLDLARAYIDMGDPEGARSILEEVLDEGDAGQRREAQSLIDLLPA